MLSSRIFFILTILASTYLSKGSAAASNPEHQAKINLEKWIVTHLSQLKSSKKNKTQVPAKKMTSDETNLPLRCGHYDKTESTEATLNCIHIALQANNFRAALDRLHTLSMQDPSYQKYYLDVQRIYAHTAKGDGSAGLAP